MDYMPGLNSQRKRRTKLDLFSKKLFVLISIPVADKKCYEMENQDCESCSHCAAKCLENEQLKSNLEKVCEIVNLNTNWKWNQILTSE